MGKHVVSPNYVVLASFPIVITLMAVTSIFNYLIFQRSPFQYTDSVSSISPWRWLFAVLSTAFICRYGYKKRSLSLPGCITAFFVGFILSLSSFTFFGALLAMYLSTSKATRFRQHLKKTMDPHFKQGGQRGVVQVLCNGIVPAELAFLYLIDHGADMESPLDFANNYYGSFWACAVLGALSCVAGDTLASELAPVSTDTQPRLITTWKRVPKGTNGGVTIFGFFCSILGGAVVGFGSWLCTLLTVPSGMLQRSPSQLYLIVICAIYGLIGSLIDSFLGATLQFSGVDTATGAIVETPRVPESSPNKNMMNHEERQILRISGYPLLNNHSVNLLSTFLTAFLAPKMAFFMYYYIS